jgi:hypothetical protein
MLPRAVMASSEAEFEAVWDSMVSEMKAERLDEYMEAFRGRHEARMKAWNS